MSQKSYFFNSVEGDRRYLAEDFAAYFGAIVTNGIFYYNEYNIYNGEYSLLVRSTSEVPMEILVYGGFAWINGYFYNNNPSRTFILDNGDSINPRIDRIVLRLSEEARSIYLAVKKGEPAVNPIPPEYTRNEAVYELVLADIYVAKGATSITDANITDQRLNSELCGAINSYVRSVYE